MLRQAMQKLHLNTGISRVTNTLANRQSPDRLSLPLCRSNRGIANSHLRRPKATDIQGIQIFICFLCSPEGNQDITPSDTVFSPNP